MSTPPIINARGIDSSASLVATDKCAVVWQEKTKVPHVRGTVIDYATGAVAPVTDLVTVPSQKPIIKKGATYSLLTWLEGDVLHGKFVRDDLSDADPGSPRITIAMGVSFFDMNYSLSGDSFVLAAAVADTIQVYRIERGTAGGHPPLKSTLVSIIREPAYERISVAAGQPKSKSGPIYLVTWWQSPARPTIGGPDPLWLRYLVLNNSDSPMMVPKILAEDRTFFTSHRRIAFSSAFDPIKNRFLVVFSDVHNIISSQIVFLGGKLGGINEVVTGVVSPDAPTLAQDRTEDLGSGRSQLVHLDPVGDDARYRKLIEIAATQAWIPRPMKPRPPMKPGATKLDPDPTNRFVIAYYDYYLLERTVTTIRDGHRTRRVNDSYEFEVFSQTLTENGTASGVKQSRFPGSSGVPFTEPVELRMPTATLSKEPKESRVFVFDDPVQWVSAERF